MAEAEISPTVVDLLPSGQIAAVLKGTLRIARRRISVADWITGGYWGGMKGKWGVELKCKRES